MDGTVFATSAGHARRGDFARRYCGAGRGASRRGRERRRAAARVRPGGERGDVRRFLVGPDPGCARTVSYLARFDRFVSSPIRDVLGQPGQYLAEGWQTRFCPRTTARRSSAARDAAFRYAHAYATKDERESDPFVEQRLGQMSLNIGCARLYHRTRLAPLGRRTLPRSDARAGIRAGFLVEKWAAETVDHVIKGLRRAQPCPAQPDLSASTATLSIYARHDPTPTISLSHHRPRSAGKNPRRLLFSSGKSGSCRQHPATARRGRGPGPSTHIRE